jgi:beta-galactosidase
MADRYRNSPHIHAWQTENEDGDHDTIYSYPDTALYVFRVWRTQR